MRVRSGAARQSLIAAAVATLLAGSLTFWRVSAAPGAAESTVVPITPTRVLDTRDPTNLGLVGPFVSPTSQDLLVTGSIPTIGGTKTVVPVGSTGVVLNVTAVRPSAAGFVSIRPADATGAPTTSNLNVTAGVIVPNAVTVALPTTGPDAGKIEITYNANNAVGPTADILVDVVGYLTQQGLQDLATDVAELQARTTYGQSTGSDQIPAFTGQYPSRGTSVALCASGDLALSGGYNAYLGDIGATLIIEESRPVTVGLDQGWQVTARNENTGNTGVFNVYVVCFDITP